jgi:hypothetical protein
MIFAKTIGAPQYIIATKRRVNGKPVITGLRINDIIRCNLKSKGINLHFAITSIGKMSFGVVVLDALADGEGLQFVVKTDPTTGKNYIDPTTDNNLQYGRKIYVVRNVSYTPSNWIWVLNLAEEMNLVASSKFQFYGICASDPYLQTFMNCVKKGDLIWFTGTDGKLLAVASYVSNNNRSSGELIDVIQSANELGWINADHFDTEIHYCRLYDLRPCEIYMRVHNGLNVFKHTDTTDEPGKIMHEDYPYICKYRPLCADLSVDSSRTAIIDHL